MYEKFIKEYIYILITLIALTSFSYIVKADDEGTSEGENSSTAPVTITYTDDSSTDTWDGTKALAITKAATITFNSDVTTQNTIYIGNTTNKEFEVTIEGNNHTITNTTSNVIFTLNKKTTINNLKITSSNASINANSNLELNNCEINSQSNIVLYGEVSGYNLVIKGGKYTTTATVNSENEYSPAFTSLKGNNTFTIESGEFNTGFGIISNIGTTIIKGGTFNLVDSQRGYLITDGTVKIEGGTFNGNNKNGTMLEATSFEVDNCSINNFDTAFLIASDNTSNKIGKNITYSNIDSEVYLYEDKTMTLDEGYALDTTIFVRYYGNIKFGDKKQITTTTQDTSSLNHLKAWHSSWSIAYDSTNQYYYMYKDPNKLSYYVNEYNELIADDKLSKN